MMPCLIPFPAGVGGSCVDECAIIIKSILMRRGYLFTKKKEKKRTLFDNRTTSGGAGGVHSCQPRGMSFEKEREVRGDVREREIMGKLLK